MKKALNPNMLQVTEEEPIEVVLKRKAEEAKKRAENAKQQRSQNEGMNTLERDYDILMKPKS